MPVRKKADAFSLVEVALALGIMAFGLVSTLGLMPIGINSFNKAMDTSISSQIAQQIMVEAQQSDFESYLGGNSGAFSKPVRYFDQQGTEGVAGQAGMIYLANTRVMPGTAMPNSAAGTANANLATVTVQVAKYPGSQTLAADPVTGLWRPPTTIPLSVFSTYVARSTASR